MNWIEKMIAEQCPNGVKKVKLGEVCEKITDGSHNLPPTVEFSDFRMISSQNIYNTRLDFHGIRYLEKEGYEKENKRTYVEKDNVLLTIVGAIGRCYVVKKEDLPFTCQRSVCVIKLNKDKYNPYFLHECIIGMSSTLERQANGAAQKGLYLKQVAQIEIPLPPPSIQKEIVSVLDKFSELIEKTDEEIALRQKQYEYYREKLLTFEKGEVEWKTINKIGQLVRGNGLQKADFREKGTGCIHYGQIYTKLGFSLNKTLSFVSDELANKLTKVEPGDLVIACTSENVEDVCKSVVWLGKETVVTGGHACVFKHNENPKYIGYCFLTHDFFQQKKQYAYGAKVIDIKTEKLGQIKLPIPSLSRQQEIVATLDKFETLISKLKEERELRQKQYEYYREKLLTF